MRFRDILGVVDRSSQRLELFANNLSPYGMYGLARLLLLALAIRLRAISWFVAFFAEWFVLAVLWVSCGYGERPLRPVMCFLVLFVASGLCYFLLGGLDVSTIGHCFYYSIVSCTALGYGSWTAEPVRWARAMGAVESVLGVLLLSLFLATVVRKMTR